jgi:hypothetical protein
VSCARAVAVFIMLMVLLLCLNFERKGYGANGGTYVR